MVNEHIWQAISANNVSLYRLAREVGFSKSTLGKLLMKPLPPRLENLISATLDDVIDKTRVEEKAKLENLTPVGKLIVQKLKSEKMSMVQFSKESGVSRAEIYVLMSDNQRKARWNTENKLSMALGIPIATFKELKDAQTLPVNDTCLSKEVE